MMKSLACAVAGLLVVGGCSSTTTSGTTDDGGAAGDSSAHDGSGGHDGGGQLDAGTGDTSTTGDSGGATTGCLGLLQCDNACTTQACSDACKANATTQGKSLYKALGDCIDLACPSTPGAVCETSGAACDKCVNDSQDPPTDAGDAGTAGMCYSQDQACVADTP